MKVKNMQQSNRELWLSFIAIISITLLYLFVVVTFGAIPGASDLFGHGIGIIGFILMFVTETLYTLRKRSRSARWGRMSTWLQFHIFTGLVGPYMVLLHSSWKFNGLAGMVMLLTIIIVASGFLGRYIYTSVPRNVDGIQIEANELEQQIIAVDGELQNWLATRPEGYRGLSNLLSTGSVSKGNRIVFGRAFEEWNARLKWWRESSRLDREARTQAKQLNELLKQERNLRRQLASIVLTRRMLGLWHAIHIPIGMVLFTAAFIHVVAALYYATLLH
jgi:putative flippase GtrA